MSQDSGLRVRKKATSQKFRKRKDTLIRKADQLQSICQAKVYVLLYRNGRFYVYKSANEAAWPPSAKQIDESYPLPMIITPESLHTTTAGPRCAGESAASGVQCTIAPGGVESRVEDSVITDREE